jgi:hypothetical protein
MEGRSLQELSNLATSTNASRYSGIVSDSANHRGPASYRDLLHGSREPLHGGDPLQKLGMPWGQAF